MKLSSVVRLGIFLAIGLVIMGVRSADASSEEGIAWIPTINQGLTEARRLNKPVMLISAAPACAGVSGIW